MSLHINPQEVYLLENYISVAYFGELRDTWAKMVTHVESCLQSFMQRLPSDYRSHKLPEQPDIVWGEHVLPNFRATLQSLNAGYILLSHGDFGGLDYSHGPKNDFRGQLEFWNGWMSDSELSEYLDLLHKSVALACNISTTEGAYWNPTDLTTRRDVQGRGLLVPPMQWPTYRINSTITVVSGAKVRQGGIYVPNLDESCAQFLSPAYDEAPPAKVLIEVRDLIDPDDGIKYDEELIIENRPCVWYMVERESDSRPTSVTPVTNDSNLIRTPGGLPCLEPGYYFTPARADSRRQFERGELFPEFDNEYGATIWQMDTDQG